MSKISAVRITEDRRSSIINQRKAGIISGVMGGHYFEAILKDYTSDTNVDNSRVQELVFYKTERLFPHISRREQMMFVMNKNKNNKFYEVKLQKQEDVLISKGFNVKLEKRDVALLKKAFYVLNLLPKSHKNLCGQEFSVDRMLAPYWAKPN